jgi:hypothetical protein
MPVRRRIDRVAPMPGSGTLVLPMTMPPAAQSDDAGVDR